MIMLNPRPDFTLGTQAELILTSSASRLARHADRISAWLDEFDPEQSTKQIWELNRVPGVDGLATLAAIPPEHREAIVEALPLTPEDQSLLAGIALRLDSASGPDTPASAIIYAFGNAADLQADLMDDSDIEPRPTDDIEAANDEIPREEDFIPKLAATIQLWPDDETGLDALEKLARGAAQTIVPFDTEFWLQALDRVTPVPDVRVLTILNDLVSILRTKGSPDQACQLAQKKMLPAWRTLPPHEGFGETLKLVAWILEEKYQLSDALKVHEECAELYAKLGDLRSKVIVHGDVIRLLRMLGRPKDALEVSESRVAIAKSLDDRPLLGTVLHDHGRLLVGSGQSGDWQQAELLLLEAIEIRSDLDLPRSHVDAAESMKALAMLFHLGGRLAEARSYAERSLAIIDDEFGDEPSLLRASARHVLGGLLKAQGDLAGARRYFERSLEIQTEVFGSEPHPSVATSMNNLAGVLQAQGDLTGARRYLERSLEIQTQVFESEIHPDVAASMHSLAGVLQVQGDLADARRYFERSLEIQTQVFGSKIHPDVATSMNNLGVLCFQQGENDAGIGLLRRALEIREAVFGTRDHFQVAEGEVMLGQFLFETGHVEEGIELLMHASVVFHQALGPEHPHTQGLM